MKRLAPIILIALLISVIVTLFILNYRAFQSQVKPNNEIPTIDRRTGATAQCKNGKYSYSTSRTGACSGNGGVKIWLKL